MPETPIAESPPEESPAALAVRYGSTPQRRRALRIGATTVAGVVAVVVVAWVVWVGLFTPTSSIETSDLGFTTQSPSTVDVRYQLSVDPGSATKCAVEALNDKFAVVGFTIVDVPASSERTRNLQTTVRTSETAVTGLIYRCWLT